MKKRKALLGSVLAGAWLLGLMTVANASPVVSLELIGAPPVLAGEVFEINVLADVGDLEIVAFGFDVLWDEDFTTYLDAVVGSPFWNTSALFANTDVAGIVQFDHVATGSEVLLATLSFRAEAVGDTVVGIFSNLNDLSVWEKNEGLFFPCPTARIDVTREIEITVTAVPLPPAVFLLSSGLGLLVLNRINGRMSRSDKSEPEKR